MKRTNSLFVVLITLSVVNMGCKSVGSLENLSTISYNKQKMPHSLLYRTTFESPIYRILLPNGCNFGSIETACSIRYNFIYNNAVFYVSDEHCEYIQEANDTLYNTLIRQLELFEKGDSVLWPMAGIVYRSGIADKGYWGYQLIYNISRESPTCWGFERLYVGYYNALSQDTAILNQCILSATSIKKRK